MSSWEVALWGAAGGSVAYLLVFILPAITRILEAQRVAKTTAWVTFVLYLVLLLVYIVLGAGSAIYVGAENVRGALTAGATGEALLKGVASSAKTLAAIGERFTGTRDVKQ